VTVDKLASEKVVVSAPMSFAGSTQRIWKLTSLGSPAAKYGTVPLAVMLALLAWCLVLCWYCIFGLLLVPYRLLRRGSRKRKIQGLQHREQLGAMERMQQNQLLQTSLLAQQQTALLAQQQAALANQPLQTFPAPVAGPPETPQLPAP